MKYCHACQTSRWPEIDEDGSLYLPCCGEIVPNPLDKPTRRWRLLQWGWDKPLTAYIKIRDRLEKLE